MTAARPPGIIIVGDGRLENAAKGDLTRGAGGSVTKTMMIMRGGLKAARTSGLSDQVSRTDGKQRWKRRDPSALLLAPCAAHCRQPGAVREPPFFSPPKPPVRSQVSRDHGRTH